MAAAPRTSTMSLPKAVGPRGPKIPRNIDDDDEDEDDFESIRDRTSPARAPPKDDVHRSRFGRRGNQMALEPYFCKLERFELFSTNQCYYLVACDKYNTQYRVLKLDRTLIEHPTEEGKPTGTNDSSPNKAGGGSTDDGSVSAPALDTAHRAKPTLRPLCDFLTEDPHTYSQEEIQDMLDMIHHGNRFTRSDSPREADRGGGGGGLKPLAKGYGIVGFIRFLDCYHLTLITRRAKVGSIGCNGVYTIKAVDIFPLKPAERGGGDEGTGDPLDPSVMLINMWNRGKRSVGLGLTNREIAELRYQGLYQVVDFSKNFYFSYTYDMTRSLQENFLATTSQPYPPPPYKDMYAWNFFLTRELEECTNSLTSHQWLLPIIHGAFAQRKLNDYGRTLNLILIARRSRHFAGTRYLKRGVSEQGKVANDVEHEQIVHDESNNVTGGTFSSYLQVRGSIPTFWTQESSVTMPKPPIEINRVDPTYRATRAHFEDLLQRYGSPIIVSDLVKQSEKREREVRVGNEYRHAIDYINTSIDDPSHQIRYCALDYSHVSKHRHLDVSTALNEVATYAVNQTGFFCSSPLWKIVRGGTVVPFGEEDKRGAKLLTEQLGVPVFPMEQRGVLRTNCIETNVAQFSAGVHALEQQLVVMGVRSSAKLDPSSTIIRVLIDMYVEIGDHISLQYGGSEAHKKVSTERSETASSFHGPIGKHKELLTSIRRYYSNAFTDRLKQDAMNLLLGFYIPRNHDIPLWEMETDYYLHNYHVDSSRGTDHSMKTYQHTFGVWNNDDPFEYKQERGSEPSNILRVRRRLDYQNHALSSWWKVAVQSHIQQRMWMKLGRSPHDSLLPSRFDRVYQPNKLAQFDRFFARNWATPVRRSHSAQHREESNEEKEALEYRRSISGHSHPPENEDIFFDPASNGGESLLEFFKLRGFEPQQTTSLARFVSYHSKTEYRQSGLGTNHQRRFIGRLGEKPQIPEEYVAYTSSISSRPVRQDRIREFKHCLHDYSLHSDDVEGIQGLAKSAHIDRTLRSGPYRGLHQSESAVEVTTVIEEQFNSLANNPNSDEGGGMSLVDMELKRRGYHTPGVREAVARVWERNQISQAQYSEVIDSTPVCRRSDLTTASSLSMYASFFDDSTKISSLDVAFMCGERQPSRNEHTRNGNNAPTDQDASSNDFIAKAAKLGITIQAYEEIVKARSSPLFNFDRKGDVPSGFEQINEDLYSRKDNKFMVFNGAGVDAWQGTEPITKVSTLTDDPLSLGQNF